MMPYFYLVPLVAAALLAYWLYYKQSVGSPQGPRSLPLIGNVHQLSTEHLEHTFARWARKYGAFPHCCTL